jgi:hypothetical protein
MSARSVVVVAGMHRAGTSVVARGLLALGLDLGDALMAADVRMNARGFFEDLDIVRTNDALLDREGADWKSVALLDAVDWRAHESERAAARDLLSRKLERTGSFAFKDPRVPRLIPFWQRVFAEMAVDDAYVIAVRHPCAVIDSLAARDDLDARRSAWLWLTHLVCALRYTHGRPRVVVDYDRMLDSPRRELARIARALALPPSALEQPDLDAFARDFLARDLRHAQYEAAHMPAQDMPQGVPEAHALAQRLARDEIEIDAPEALAQIDAQFENLAAISPLLSYAGSLERIADDVPRLAGELAWARASLGEAITYNEDLAAAVGRKDEYAAEVAAALARKESDLVAAHMLIDRVRAHLLGRVLVRLARKKG